MNAVTLRPVAYLSILATVLGALAYVLILHAQYHEAQAEALRASAQLELSEQANKSNQTTITEQKLALQKWAITAKELELRARGAVDALDLAEKRVHQDEKLLQALEAKDNAVPACDALLATDPAKPCPAHAEAIRKRAE